MSSPKNYTNQVVALDTERHGASGNVLINAKKDVLKSTSFLCFIEYSFPWCAADCGREPG